MHGLLLVQAVGKNCANRSEDVKAVQLALARIGKLDHSACNGTVDDRLVRAIESLQRHFLQRPDGVIAVQGQTHRVLAAWREKPIAPGVQLSGRLKDAWQLVSPLLPEGSSCVSGYRSADQQRAILHRFFQKTYKQDIIAKYGQAAFETAEKDLTLHEARVLEMVKGVGQAISAPGKSKHQQGKAIDVGGPSQLDDKQVEVIKRVAHAHPELFSGFVIKERNGCVHFEIR